MHSRDRTKESIDVNERRKESIHVNERRKESIHISEQRKESIDVNERRKESIHVNEQRKKSIHVNERRKESIHVIEQRKESIHVNERSNVDSPPASLFGREMEGEVWSVKKKKLFERSEFFFFSGTSDRNSPKSAAGAFSLFRFFCAHKRNEKTTAQQK